jgi:glutamate carboxypeptidase
MVLSHWVRHSIRPAAKLLLAASCSAVALMPAWAQTQTDPAKARVQSMAQAQTPALLDTLKTLVSIESGSRDLEGLEKISHLIGNRLQQLGMEVKTIPTQAPDFHPQLKGAKLGSVVMGTKKGKGQKKVLMIAHMDTVYLKGMVAKQPFRIDGNRAYGLAISDDKGGVALILHTVQMLQDLGFDDYAELAVAINGDEEVGSAGSSALLVRLGEEYDAVMSFEGGGVEKTWCAWPPAALPLWK